MPPPVTPLPGPDTPVPSSSRTAPASGRPVRPVHLFGVAALLQFVAIPLPWASARLFEGSVTIDGLEAAPFGTCAFVSGVLALAAGVAADRGARGWMAVWAVPAVVGSLLFAVAMLVLDSILANAVEWVFAERVATADAGLAVWLVLAAGLTTSVAAVWTLLAAPLPPHGRPGVLWATLTLGPALWRATRRHYRGT